METNFFFSFFLFFFFFTAIVNKPDKEAEVANFMQTSLPGTELVNNIDGAMFFKVPNIDDEILVAFFKTVEEKRDELGITDFSVGLTTLEEVFLELSKRDQFIIDDPDDPDAAIRAAAAEQVKQLQFSIPEGAEPGMTLQVPHPDGPPNKPLNYEVKENDKPGVAVTIQYVQAAKANMAKLQFPIPEGATAGVTVALARPGGGDDIHFTIPEGVKPGQMHEIEYLPMNQNGAKVATVYNRPTFFSYLSALAIKTGQFQKTRAVQCCCIVFMPVVLMLLLLSLNLLFAGLRVTSMCGEGITQENCAAEGYNLTCVKQLSEMTRGSAPPALLYGEVQRGWGVNRNCGDDVPKGSSRNEVCYAGLEKPKFSMIPMTASATSIGIGSLSNTRLPAVVEWYEGFRYTMTSSTCSEAFNDAFQYETGCAEDKTPECSKRISDLVLTKSWRTANPKDGQATTGSARGGFFNQCLPKNLDSDRRRRRNLAEYRPTDAQIAAYDALVDLKDICQSNWLLNVSSRLAVAPSIQSGVTTKRTGVLGNFTTAGVVDPGYTSIQSAVLTNVGKYLALDSDSKEKRCNTLTTAPLVFSHKNISDICTSTTITVGGTRGTPVQTMLAKNASNCNECFSDAMGGMYGLLMQADGFTTEMNSLFMIMQTGLGMSFSPSSLGFVGSNIFGDKNWNRWATSVCQMNNINDLYTSGKITTGTMRTRQGQTVPKCDATAPSSGCQLWDQFWPGFYEAFMLSFDSTSMDSGKLAWKSFCDMDSDIDAARGLTFNSYGTKDEVNTALWDNWGGDNVETDYMKKSAPRNVVGYKHHYYNTQTMAFDFQSFDTETGVFDYIAYFNNSGTDDKKTGNWLAISDMIITPIFDEMLGQGSKPTMQLNAYPKPFLCEREKWLAGEAYSCPSLLQGFLSISIVDFILMQFLPIILMLMIYPTVTAIVYEKQAKLRMIMKMQGLPMYVYYIVTYCLHYAMYVVICILITITGALSGVQFFTIHNMGIVWLFFLLWGHLMLAFAFFLSAFLARMRTAMAVTFLIILILWQCGGTLFQQFLNNPNTTEGSYIPLMILPPWQMFRWVYWFGLASAFGEAITPQSWSVIGGGVLPKMIWVQVLTWFIYMGLYWYLENVMVVGHGTAKSCCFCLDLRYWGMGQDSSNKSNKVADADAEERARLNSIPIKVLEDHSKWHSEMYPTSTDHVWKRPHDVQKEHERTLKFEDIKSGKDPKVRICSMHKVFPAVGSNAEKMAVKCVSFGVNKKECFGLLGHNGAGKTTLLNMLTGLYPATSGTAFVDDLRLDRDLGEIYAKMGVCPQHDILWESLTGRHHVSTTSKKRRREHSVNGCSLDLYYSSLFQT